jgi:phosphonate transport system permease protein
MTVAPTEITSFEITPTERPTPPPRSGPFFVVMLLVALGFAVGGAVSGGNGVVWGLVGGVFASGALRWRRIGAGPVDALALAFSSAIGVGLSQAALEQRGTSIDAGTAFSASLGWVLVGAAMGFIAWRHSRRLRLPSVVVSALAWGVAAFLVFLWAEELGAVEALSRSARQAGEALELTGTTYGITGFFIALVGAGVTSSLLVGTPALAAAAGAATFTLFAAARIGFSLIKVATEIDRLNVLAQDFWPPEWTWANLTGQPVENQILEPMVETLQIAVIGATIGCLVALPVAFLASKVTAFNTSTFWGNRFFMNIIRTIPDLFWAMIFVSAVGFGSPFAGALAMIMFSLGIMAKLLSETVDSIDPGPLEASRAAGARHSQVVQYSAMPQVLPNYVAYALYIFELNIRASVVIGIVGAGGIGRLLDEQRVFFQWDRVMAIVLVIWVSVMLIEVVSVTMRRRLV